MTIVARFVHLLRYTCKERRAAHEEAVVRCDLHAQIDLLPVRHHYGLVDLHILELHREVLDLLASPGGSCLPGSAHIGGGRHEHAAVDVVVDQERMLALCKADEEQ